MSLSIYKPNSSNTGAGFSFQIGLDGKTRETVLYIKAILQHSWDSQKKQGYFKDNLENPDKNIVLKFNEFEIGHIIHALRTRNEYNTFHSFGDDKTSIRFTPWDKIVQKKQKTASGSWEDAKVTIPAFGINFTRNGNQVFKIGLEPGESESVMELCRYILQRLYQQRVEKQIEQIKKTQAQQNG